MKNILSYTGNSVYIGHFQGEVIKNYTDIVTEYSTKQISVSPKVSVITAFNNKDEAITALQLELSNVDYKNGCSDITNSWSNVDKIKYYVDILSKTTSEYSLLVDAYDVLFFKSIDDEFINKFKELNKRIIFNATKNNHPNFKIDYVPDRESMGEFKYLNAGVVFGYTDDLLAFYQEALEKTKRADIINPWESEQLYIRMTSNGKDYVGFDHECVLFQTFSKTSKTVCGNTIIIT